MATSSSPGHVAAAEPAPPADSFELRRQLISARSQEQKRLIARIKRFQEWLLADREFRLALAAHPEQATPMMAVRGLEVDPHALEPLWRPGITTANTDVGDKHWPQFDLWRQWMSDVHNYPDPDLLISDQGITHPAFARWRRRCATGNDFLIGPDNKYNAYCMFAYELSKGCSQNCWFCALDAPRLEAVFRYDHANARLWRQILEAGVEMLGAGVTYRSICYWATEPFDNPDYIRFIKDYLQINGFLCCTTTAAATRNPAWARQLLALYSQDVRSSRLRFSVLSLEMLQDIHRLYSPDDLLYVDCLSQNPESIFPKTKSGRAAYDQHRSRQGGRTPAEPNLEPLPAKDPEFSGTSACVAGYLVDMVTRTVKLISPCQASARWPLGYRVHAEGRFDSAADYRGFIKRTIEELMPLALPADSPARFQEDVSYAEGLEGPMLRSRVKSMRLDAAGPAYGPVASLLAQGGRTPSEIMASLIGQGQSPLDVIATLNHFFEMGLMG